MLQACSFRLPYQPEQQKQHGYGGGGQPQRIEIDRSRKHDQVNEYEEVGDRQTAEAKAAPQQEPLPAPRVAAQQQDGAAESHQGADDVNGSSHHSLSFLRRNARAKSRKPAGALEWIIDEMRTTSFR